MLRDGINAYCIIWNQILFIIAILIDEKAPIILSVYIFFFIISKWMSWTLSVSYQYYFISVCCFYLRKKIFLKNIRILNFMQFKKLVETLSYWHWYRFSANKLNYHFKIAKITQIYCQILLYYINFCIPTLFSLILCCTVYVQ